MKLILDPAPSWVVEQLGGATRIRVGDAPTLTIDVSAISPLPDNANGWAQAVLRADLPPETVLNVVMATDLTTVDGWRLTVIESVALAADSNQVVETRLHVFYSLLFHGALVVARSASSEAFERHRTEILDRMGRARPDWSGDIVALAQIFNVDDDRAPAEPPAPLR